MQLPVMAVEEFGEGEAVAGDVCRQQFGIAALLSRFLPNPLREAHSPDSNQSSETRHFTRCGPVRTWLAP